MGNGDVDALDLLGPSADAALTKCESQRISFTAWQCAAIEELESQSDSNGVIAAPTSSGKGLVGRAIFFKELERHGASNAEGIWLTPLRVLEGEASRALNDGAQELSCTASAMTPEKGLLDFRRRSLARISALRVVVVDEAHTLGDFTRGTTLDCILAMALLARKQSGRSQPSPRIILLSATIGGVHELAEWLDACLFATNTRAVPLDVHLGCSGSTYRVNRVGTSRPGIDRAFQQALPGDPWDALVALCTRTVNEGGSVLCFVRSRAASERCAEGLLERVETLNASGAEGLADQTDLRSEGNAQRHLLQCLAGGVAFHHAGLLDSERAVVEEAFSDGRLRVLFCTTTLAAGVNLPANVAVIYGFPRDSTSPQVVQQVKHLSALLLRCSFLFLLDCIPILPEEVFPQRL